MTWIQVFHGHGTYQLYSAATICCIVEVCNNRYTMVQSQKGYSETSVHVLWLEGLYEPESPGSIMTLPGSAWLLPSFL